MLLENMMTCPAQAGQIENASFAEPLRRYAIAAASDIRLNHRGTLTNGTLRTGGSFTRQPEARSRGLRSLLMSLLFA